MTGSSDSPEPGGPWLVRMAAGHYPALRAMTPLQANSVEQLEQILGGIFSAISLLGPGMHSHIEISIDQVRQ